MFSVIDTITLFCGGLQNKKSINTKSISKSSPHLKGFSLRKSISHAEVPEFIIFHKDLQILRIIKNTPKKCNYKLHELVHDVMSHEVMSSHGHDHD